jgi:hypothetical protein
MSVRQREARVSGGVNPTTSATISNIKKRWKKKTRKSQNLQTNGHVAGDMASMEFSIVSDFEGKRLVLYRSGSKTSKLGKRSSI